MEIVEETAAAPPGRGGLYYCSRWFQALILLPEEEELELELLEEAVEETIFVVNGVVCIPCFGVAGEFGGGNEGRGRIKL
jgi:hypothetical protein